MLLGLGIEARHVAEERAVPGTFASLLPDTERVRTAFEAAVVHTRNVLASVQELGACVPDMFAPVDLDTVAMAARRARVLVFLTHYDLERGLQLGSQLVPMRHVVEAIGPDFDGVIDLGACNTNLDVVTVLREGCPNARCIIYDGLQRLEARGSIIRAVQVVLAKRPRRYIEVLTDVLSEFLIQARTWNGDDNDE